jgi:hypothetical protein
VEYSFEKINPIVEPVNDGDIVSTLNTVLKEAVEDNNIVLVCGSFYIMSDVREFFNFTDEYDHRSVNLV